MIQRVWHSLIFRYVLTALSFVLAFVGAFSFLWLDRFTAQVEADFHLKNSLAMDALSAPINYIVWNFQRAESLVFLKGLSGDDSFVTAVIWAEDSIFSVTETEAATRNDLTPEALADLPATGQGVYGGS